MTNYKIFNDDCFNVFPNIKDKTINLFLLDLPYAQTACKWDSLIDLDKMWEQIKRTMKSNAVVVFFCTTKFGNTLINSNPKWFRYDLVWEKSKKVGFLSANKMPLRKHEMVYIFSDACNDDIEITRYKELREYANKVLKYIGKSKKDIIKELGLGLDRFFRIKNSQFRIPNKNNYEKLTELYNLDKMEGYLNYELLEKKYKEESETTYNSQKIEGKPYKTKGGDIESYYREEGVKYKLKGIENKGERHPTSILQFEDNHEMVYIFSDACNDDIEITRNKELREYAKKVLKYIGKSKKDIIKELGQGLDHFFRIKSSQFGIPIKENYEKLTELYNLDKMEGYLNYELLEKKYKEESETTYNSQKIEGKPYKVNDRKCEIYSGNEIIKGYENKGDRHPHSILKFEDNHEMVYIFKKEGGTYNPQMEEGEAYKKKCKRSGGCYGELNENFTTVNKENKGDRYPTTILKFNNPVKSLHRTQKPTDLLEWLIKSYSNENDMVCDFTMGSGSTGIACLNTKRQFLGVERDKDIFKVAEVRLKAHLDEVNQKK
jgi:DNA modification methylase